MRRASLLLVLFATLAVLHGTASMVVAAHAATRDDGTHDDAVLQPAAMLAQSACDEDCSETEAEKPIAVVGIAAMPMRPPAALLVDRHASARVHLSSGLVSCRAPPLSAPGR